MARTGRPKKEISQTDFEKLCALQCTEREICDWFECGTDTLNSWCKKTYKNEHGKAMTFSEVFAQKRSKGKISLRRSQWKLAEKNANMAIWLGKQYLDQKESNNGATDEMLDKLDEVLDSIGGVV